MIHGLTSEWGSIISSVADGTQPAATTYGTSVTPGTSNAYGNYASVMSGSSLTADAYGIEIVVTGAFANATDRGILLTIGFDPAGGTTFGGLGGVTSNEISHLLCSGASNWYGSTGAGGHRFYFPLFIKAGTSIGAKAQTNEGTARTVRVACNLYCRPSRPDAVRAGSFVRTFGATTASTDGTGVTQGTTSEGSWTEIGTASDTIWYLETGIGSRTSTMANDMSHTDIGAGDAGNKRVLINGVWYMTTANETTNKSWASGAYCNIASGDKIYARSQSSTAQTGFSVACYGVGG